MSELSPNFVMEGIRRQGLSLRSDNLDSIDELYTEDDFRQRVVAIEATPTSFGSLGELEDHGETATGFLFVGAQRVSIHRCARV